MQLGAVLLAVAVGGTQQVIVWTAYVQRRKRAAQKIAAIKAQIAANDREIAAEKQRVRHLRAAMAAVDARRAVIVERLASGWD